MNAPIARTVVLSGGLDSTSVLALALEDYPADQVTAVSFDYGQRHKKELIAAARIAEHYGVRHSVVPLEGLLSGSALLYQEALPEGHYAEDTMKATVVNGRNLLFASTAIAATPEGGEVWLGVHAGDHFIYPDCRPEFWMPLKEVVRGAYQVELVTPFLFKTKAKGLEAGLALGAPVELSWSCYAGGDVHCGKCGTCVERAEAFDFIGADDPTEYEDAEFWRTAVANAPIV